MRKFDIFEAGPHKVCGISIRGFRFTLKTDQIRTRPEEFRNAISTGYFRFVIEENSVFGPHENEKQAFSNSSGLKSVFKKTRFRDGLV